MTLTVVISLAVVGITGVILNYSSTNALLEQNMVETAEIAAQRVEYELEADMNVAYDAGCVARLADPDMDVAGKQEILDQRAATHGLVGGNILDENGISIIDGNDYSDREYVQEALAGRTHISEPILSKDTGEMSVMVAAPLWEGGVPDTNVAGVICFTPVETFLNDIVADINVSPNSSAYILDAEGTTIAHINADEVKNKDNVIENAKSDASLAPLAEISQKMIGGESGFGSYSYDGSDNFLAYAPIGGTDGWSLGINAPVSDFMDATIEGVTIALILQVAAAIVAIILAVRLSAGISKPIGQCCDRLELLARGDLNSPVPQIDKKDETGRLAQSTGIIVAAFKGVIDDVSWGLGELADGNFTVSSKAKELYTGDFAR